MVYYANKSTERRATEKNVDKVRSLTDWVPESGGYLFESNRPNLLSTDLREFFGRNEVLTVQFPGTRININANLLRTSIDADVAEIKVESSASLSKLQLADDNSVQIGEKMIVALGYPGGVPRKLSPCSNRARAERCAAGRFTSPSPP